MPGQIADNIRLMMGLKRMQVNMFNTGSVVYSLGIVQTQGQTCAL